MKILIVDDNASMRRLIKTVLSDFHAEFVECADGGKALENYRLSKPDIVLMDIMMPEVDGLEATRRIRAAFPDARVVVVTYYDDPDLRKAATSVGAAGYVLKEDLSQLRAFCVQ